MPQLETATYVSQLIWLAISFGALYYIMSKIALPKIGAAIERRHTEISSDLDSAEQFKAQTEKAIADYEQALADARAKAHSIAKEMGDKIAAEMSAEAEKLDAEIAEKVKAAETRIGKARQEAMSQVEAIAKEGASEIVSLLIGTKPAAGRVSDAVTDALKT